MNGANNMDGQQGFEMYPVHDQPGAYPQMQSLNPQFYLNRVRPLVRYGLREAQYTGIRHAVTEVALIAYLLGAGYDFNTAYRIVESWEVDETFPSFN